MTRNKCNHHLRYEIDLSEFSSSNIQYIFDNHLPWSTPKADCSVNANICDFGRCMCDVELAFRLHVIFYENVSNYGGAYAINPDFITNQDGSGFDHQNRCKTGSSKPPGSDWSSGSEGLSPVIGCCGNYPNRVPYNSFRQTCCGKGETGAHPFLVGYGAC